MYFVWFRLRGEVVFQLVDFVGLQSDLGECVRVVGEYELFVVVEVFEFVLDPVGFRLFDDLVF